ncbi:TetR/AcrR family transcriptional regulator [Solirubrobacter ginsenosidimutans]|uniref:TetR/AcrR family transcriptional regulator n=1 Tax=Solirubrobacter ginsenosidimutans TaxID=490573 RepID=A0A9X3S3H1_9ACTN|nr:TetR/AcrR family transcriptional regulator [Solirubrobacter ginsenosidimutans]MDA0162106.1 TetR/AcrR family transcriptional regulator [Solirubrobacter ginsenosidimutans]
MARVAYTTPEGRARRDQLVRAAMQAFAQRGYHGVTMDTIAAEVGVTRQGLLHHFPSKVDLLVAVLERRDEDDSELLSTLRAREDTPLAEILRAVLRHNAQRPGLAALFTILSAESVDPEHPAHDWFADRYRRGRILVAEWIAAEQARGRITSAATPQRLATSVLALLDGLQLQQQLEDEPLDIDGVLAELLALLR